MIMEDSGMKRISSTKSGSLAKSISLTKTISLAISSLIVWLALAATSRGNPEDDSGRARVLAARIEALKVPDVAWRKIPWKSCVLEGLEESRRTGKPLMLWVFIDRPVDDTRC